MRVVVVAEYYPRAADPALGVWAHRQAMATRDAGVDVEVVVLHRPVPSRAALRSRSKLLEPLRQPLHTRRDGLRVTYVPFVAPPRPRSYPAWGAWAAPTLALALRSLKPFDLVHAHYAAPAGDAVRRARPGVPVVVSVHGGDVLGLVRKWAKGREVVERSLRHARLTLANSGAIAQLSETLGARDVRVVHLGTDVPEPGGGDGLVTVGNLIARKRHADVLHALTELPGTRYVIVGDGPERPALERLARELRLDVDFRGAVSPHAALAAARGAAVFVLPSVEEAFGVAYIEAMAAGVPAIGTRGEPGPEEIAACGGGMTLVAPGELAQAIKAVLANRDALGHAARENVLANFTWERCGRATAAAYEDALR